MSMREYEITLTYCNGCAGAARPVISIFEAASDSPEAFLQEKHGRDAKKFRWESQPDGRTVCIWSNEVITYCYEFTEIG